jgi:arylsulfatase A-like enzyme
MKTKWIIIASLLLSPLAALHAADAPASNNTRPNILFIYTDDQRWDALGVLQKEQGDQGRFPWLKTPNMDRLAGEGVRFRNAFVVTSLCSPSRANFLTGQYGHRNGVKGNAEDFPVTNITCASLLSGAGYATGYFGKWHMGEQRGKRPGFTTSASYIGHGKYLDCPFEVDGVEHPTKGWVDTATTDFALDFIRQNTKRPFFAMVGFKTPHDNRQPRLEDSEAYANAQSTMPPNANSIPPFGQGKSNKLVGTKQPIKPYDRQYFQTLNGADHNLGRLLDALDELGLSENTIVIYTSDNGYFMGEHTLGDKRFAYDESLRIPLLLRYPKLGLKGKVVDDMVLNIDFAPTALDFASEPVHPLMQGRSWKPLLDGKTSDWRRSFYYEYFVDSTFPNIPPVQALRTEDAKLIVYPGHEDWTELYDLRKDPFETNNLVKLPASADLLARLRAEFLKGQQRAATP